MTWFLTQTEYDALMLLLKEFKERDPLILNDRWSREITAPVTGDNFMLDFYRGRIEFKKFSLNKRYRKTVVLVRYCSHGSHTNPDDTRFDGPHLHLYREGYDDKYAVDVVTIGATSSSSVAEVLEKFLAYCKIKPVPVKPSLF